MSETMIERVARAIASARGMDPEAQHPMDSGKQWWERYVLDARAAIEALREPTKEMMPAGLAAIRDNMDVDRDSYETRDYPTEATAYHCFVDMIDAALSPNKETDR